MSVWGSRVTVLECFPGSGSFRHSFSEVCVCVFVFVSENVSGLGAAQGESTL